MLGENGILYIYDEVANAYKPVACLTSNDLSTNVSAIESNTKCHRGVRKVQAGTFTYEISAEAENTVEANKNSHKECLALQMAKELVTWKIDTDVDVALSQKYFGTALITDLSISQGSGDDLTTFSITLMGDGTILLTDPKA